MSIYIYKDWIFGGKEIVWKDEVDYIADVGDVVNRYYYTINWLTGVSEVIYYSDRYKDKPDTLIANISFII